MSTAPAIHIEEPRRTTPAGELHRFPRRFTPIPELPDQLNALLAEVSRATLTKGAHAGEAIVRETAAAGSRIRVGMLRTGEPHSLGERLGWHPRKLRRWLRVAQDRELLERRCLGRGGKRCRRERGESDECRGHVLRLTPEAWELSEKAAGRLPKRRRTRPKMSDIARATLVTNVRSCPPATSKEPPNRGSAERNQPSPRKIQRSDRVVPERTRGEGSPSPPAHSREIARKILPDLEAKARAWTDAEELPTWPNREGTIAKRIEAGASAEDLTDALLGALVTRANELPRRPWWETADPFVAAAGSQFNGYRELGAQEREAEELKRQEREKAERRERDRCRECEAGGHEFGERRDRGKGRWWAQCRCGKRATANDPGLREDLRLFGKLVDEPGTPAQAQAPESSEAAWDELAERYDRERQARSIGPPPDARQKLVDLGVLE